MIYLFLVEPGCDEYVFAIFFLWGWCVIVLSFRQVFYYYGGVYCEVGVYNVLCIVV